MRIPGLLFVAAACLAAGLAPECARAQGAALTVRAGTLGISGGATVGVAPRLGVRVDVPYLKGSYSSTATLEDFDMDYDAEVTLFGVGGLIDWYPFGGAFRLSGGGYYNSNEINLLGRSKGSYTIGSISYSPDEIGELDAKVEMGNTIAPYIGIGVGNAVGGRGFGFTFDAGALYMGAPRVTAVASRLLTPMAEEARIIESNLAWAKWYPSVAIGAFVKVF